MLNKLVSIIFGSLLLWAVATYFLFLSQQSVGKDHEKVKNSVIINSVIIYSAKNKKMCNIVIIVINGMYFYHQDKLSNQISRLEKQVKQQITINEELLKGINENKRRKSKISVLHKNLYCKIINMRKYDL